MTKRQKQEQAAAVETLRELMPIGTTLYTTLRHVSRSGMSRRIACIVTVDGEPRNVSRFVALAIGARLHRDSDSVVVGGCGMDMGFHVANTLSYALHGYPADAPRCAKHRKTDYGYCGNARCFHAGYTLPHRWL